MLRFLLRFVMVVVCLFLVIQIVIFGQLAWWRTHPVETSMFMRIYYYTAAQPHLQHEWRDYDEVNTSFKQAVVAAEDAKFMQHHGFDWDGILYALEKNQKKGNIVAGGSTISQQLAKNLFLFNQRSYIRKAEEVIIVWMMERMWDKQRILEVYVNSVELGEGIYGVEAAARHYYGKSAKNLSQDQAIRLAALLPNPKYYQNHPKDKKYVFKQRFIRKYIHTVRIP